MQVQRPLVPAQTCPRRTGLSQSERAPETRSGHVQKTRSRRAPEPARPWPQCSRRPGPQQPLRQRRMCDVQKTSLLSHFRRSGVSYVAEPEMRRSLAARTSKTSERGVSVATVEGRRARPGPLGYHSLLAILPTGAIHVPDEITVKGARRASCVTRPGRALGG